jgi:hypothetical protein
MRKLGLLVWPLAALLGAITITLTAPTHASSPLVQNGGSTSLLPS